MQPDALIRVRFKTTAEGGREHGVGGCAVPFYAAPLLVDEQAFDCRLLLEDRVLELGETYEVPVKFMSPDLALASLVPGKAIGLWEGREVATGQFVRVMP
jgi:hypothetical protein